MYTPDPLNVQRDELYGIYRRGLISRHIARNGRYIEAIPLMQVPLPAPPQEINEDSSVTVFHSAPKDDRKKCVKIKIPLANARYSEEVDRDLSYAGRYLKNDYLFVPILAPIKYPGISTRERLVRMGGYPGLPMQKRVKRVLNDSFYYVIPGQGDNPGYYGGMALALFSLEHLRGVSKYSIQYARLLAEFFLRLEMPDKRGFIFRRDRWFQNKDKVTECRGGSPEELLGIMLGIMYYLRVEDRTNPLYNQMSALRDRILLRVSETGDFAWSSYEHPVMTASFCLKPFEFALYASKGEARGSEALYRSTVTLLAGDSNPTTENFFNYALLLTSMILVLEGGLGREKKRELAEIFMEHFIKAATTAGPAIHSLKKNNYLGVVALLIKKYVRNEKFTKIWDGHEDVWQAIVESVRTRIYECKSLKNEFMNIAGQEDHWQHNLPFVKVCNESKESVSGTPSEIVAKINVLEQQRISREIVDYEIREISLPNATGIARMDYTLFLPWSSPVWRDHNPHNRIGDHFSWGGKYPHIFRRNPGKFADYSIGWGGVSGFMNEAEYNASGSKRFPANALQYHFKEIKDFQGSSNCQVEAGGLDLLFMRILLTEADHTQYPPPRLNQDEFFPVLPFPGVNACSPTVFKHFQHLENGIMGRRLDAMSITTAVSRKLAVIAMPSQNNSLVIESWQISAGLLSKIQSIPVDLYPRQVILKKTKDGVLSVISAPSQLGRLRLRALVYEFTANSQLSCEVDAEISQDLNKEYVYFAAAVFQHHYLACLYKEDKKTMLRICSFSKDAVSILFECTIVEDRLGTDEREIYYPRFVSGASKDLLVCAIRKQSVDSDDNLTEKLMIVSGLVSVKAFVEKDRIWISSLYNESGDRGMLVLCKNNKHYLLVLSSDWTSENSHFEVSSYEIGQDGKLKCKGSYAPKVDDLLHEPIEYNSLKLSKATIDNENAFLVCGSSKIKKGSDQEILRLYAGTIMHDGSPTIFSTNYTGRGFLHDVWVCDISESIPDEEGDFVVTGHIGGDNVLMLDVWRIEGYTSVDGPFRSDPQEFRNAPRRCTDVVYASNND